MNTEGRNGPGFSEKEPSITIVSEIEDVEAEREEELEVDPVHAQILEIKKKHHLLELQDNCDNSQTRKTSKLNEVQSAAESDKILLTKTEKHSERTKEVSSVYQVSNQAIANNNSSQQRISWLPIVVFGSIAFLAGLAVANYGKFPRLFTEKVGLNSLKTSPIALPSQSVIPNYLKNDILSDKLTSTVDRVREVAMSPERTLVIAGSQEIVIWDFDANSLLTKIPISSESAISSLAISDDGKTIAAGYISGAIAVWKLGQQQAAYTFNNNHSYRILSLALNHDGSELAAGDLHGALIKWNLKNNSEEIPEDLPLLGHTGAINNLAFDRQGNLASASNDMTVIIWNSAGKKIQRLSDTKEVFALAFSPDGNKLYTGNLLGTLRVWNVSTGELEKTHSQQTQKISSVDVSDNNIIVTGSNDLSIVAWNVLGRFQRLPENHAHYINGVNISSDAKIVVSFDSKEIKVFASELPQSRSGDF
ncbi:MAG: WD40 repeat domain-containing protein [Prochloraceae cyanobacterium]